MPTYAFICRACDNTFEEFLWFSEKLPTECPFCGEGESGRFGQNFMANRPVGRCYGEDRITTVGQQAELNARRTGKEQMQLMAEAEKAKRSGWHGEVPEGAKITEKPKDTAPPWWRESNGKPLDLKEVRDTERYIMTGEK